MLVGWPAGAVVGRRVLGRRGVCRRSASSSAPRRAGSASRRASSASAHDGSDRDASRTLRVLIATNSSRGVSVDAMHGSHSRRHRRHPRCGTIDRHLGHLLARGAGLDRGPDVAAQGLDHPLAVGHVAQRLAGEQPVLQRVAEDLHHAPAGGGVVLALAQQQHLGVLAAHAGEPARAARSPRARAPGPRPARTARPRRRRRAGPSGGRASARRRR